MSPLLEKRLLIGYDQLTVTNLLSKKNLIGNLKIHGL